MSQNSSTENGLETKIQPEQPGGRYLDKYWREQAKFVRQLRRDQEASRETRRLTEQASYVYWLFMAMFAILLFAILIKVYIRSLRADRYDDGEVEAE